MNIERLEELKDEFENERKYNDMRYMSTATEDDVLELIDEAIARQSATSEEVAEAISYIQGGYGDVWLWSKKRRDTIITALQAYQPWVSVEDRLPERGKHVLLCFEVISSGDRYVCDNWGDYSSIFIGDFVTHWKPLPEPPKGE